MKKFGTKIQLFRKTILSVLPILSLVILFSCDNIGLNDNTHTNNPERYMELKIGPPASGSSKMMSSTGYSVTNLNIVVTYTATEEVVFSVTWNSADGSTSYTVPVSSAGEYEVSVTHISSNGTETIEAGESLSVIIEPMIITVVNIVPGSIGMINILSEPEEMPVVETNVRHYVAGNLFSSGDYRTTSFDVPENLIKAVIGLDYTDGTDTFFASSVTDTYGLNRIRWYTLTSTDGINFISDIDDSVVIEGSTLKVRTNEFSAATSKEGLALRRIIGVYMASASATPSGVNTLVRHLVYGNLFNYGEYRGSSSPIPANLKKIVVGLDYTGGTDTFFTPSVTDTYGLNRIRWYTLNSTDGVNFTSDSDDTVIVESGTLRVRTDEYDASTSKEGLELRRILSVAMHD